MSTLNFLLDDSGFNHSLDDRFLVGFMNHWLLKLFMHNGALVLVFDDLLIAFVNERF
jgi:hypothetical protein